MRIRNNTSASNTGRMIKKNTKALSGNTEKLSSGYRINRAADDAAGLSISEKMRQMIRGLTRASSNCEDGISLVQTAEGALNEVHEMLQRLNELSIQSANGTNSDSDREDLQKEFSQLLDEINRVSKTTTFNGMRVFTDGDEPAGTVGVERVIAESSTSATHRGTGVTCGAFIVYGGSQGVDYEYDSINGVLTILSGTGLTIEGTVSETTDRIAIDDSVDANITLSNVNIYMSVISGGCAFMVGDNATLNLTLEGKNTLVSGAGYAGLQLCSGVALVITEESTGSLNATGGSDAAGIGSGRQYGSCGDIIINGGTVTAKGGAESAGIGSGYHGSCGDIIINGGTVTATGNTGCAGIGSCYQGSSGEIIISGGTVIAKGGTLGAGIGSGYFGNNGDISINGGTVTATSTGWGAGIGSGCCGSSEDIKISGGTVLAIGGYRGAGIGSGQYGNCENIIINGGRVTVTGGEDADNIGSGDRGSCGTVTISGNALVTDTTSTTDTTDTTSTGKTTTYGFHSKSERKQWWIQAGAEAGVGMKIEIGAMNTKVLGLNGANILTGKACDSTIDLVAEAVKKISAQRTRLGAYQNRLEHTIRNLDNVVENTTAAESRIRDTDMAAEMVTYSIRSILLQAGQSMLTQANQTSEGVLTVLH